MTKAILNDELWQIIEPLIPKKKRRFRYPGRKHVPDRAVLTGILFVLKTGIAWEHLPQEMGCGSGMTCWRRLRGWQKAGVWDGIHQVLLSKLRQADQIDFCRAVVDSGSVRAVFGGANRAKSDGPPRKVRNTFFGKIRFRGDADFSQTEYLDGWDEQGITLVFGISAMPNLVRIAESLLETVWEGLIRIREILEQDKFVHKKQRHTAKRIWEVLQEEGFTGGYTIVEDAVRELRRTTKEVYMPLIHRPGEAQVDFGHALVKMSGVLREISFFVMTLPYSDAFFIRAYERECTETFWDGHVRAFEFFGGVARRITYDNSKIAISRIIGPRLRELTQGFLQLASHYLFDYHFCLVRRANEKGVVAHAFGP